MSYPHEQVVQFFASGLFGGIAINDTADVRKGSGSREPGGDLVFLALGGVILCHIKKVHPHATKPEKDLTKFEDAVERNLEQAGGAIRHWRDLKEPIHVGNARTRQELRWGDHRVVVLSVIDSPIELAMDHPQFARAQGIALCCTIPLRLIEFMASKLMSVVDLLSLLRDLHDSGVQWGPRQLHDALEARLRSAWIESGALARWPKPEQSFRDAIGFIEEVRMNAGRFRGGAAAVHGGAGWLVTLTQLLNDLPLVQTLRLVKTASEMLDHPDPQMASAAYVRGPFHDIVLMCKSGGMLALCPEELMTWVERARTTGVIRAGPTIWFSREDRGLSSIAWSGPSPGHAEYLCRSIYI